MNPPPQLEHWKNTWGLSSVDRHTESQDSILEGKGRQRQENQRKSISHRRHTAQATSRMDEAQVVEALARHQTYTWAPGRDDKEEEGHPPSSKARKGSKEKPAPPRLHYCSSNWCSLLPLPQGDHPPLQGTPWFDQLIGLAIEYYFKRGTKSASSPTNLTLRY